MKSFKTSFINLIKLLGCQAKWNDKPFIQSFISFESCFAAIYQRRFTELNTKKFKDSNTRVSSEKKGMINYRPRGAKQQALADSFVALCAEEFCKDGQIVDGFKWLENLFMDSQDKDQKQQAKLSQQELHYLVCSKVPFVYDIDIIEGEGVSCCSIFKYAL